MGMTESEANSMIWCAKTEDVPFLNEAELLTGFKASWAMGQMAMRGDWKRRGDVEEDREWRQVIPYTLVHNAFSGRFLASERTDKQGESRLHGKTSIGMGGHIEMDDMCKNEGAVNVGGTAYFPVHHKSKIIEQAAWREIKEETGFLTGLLAFGGIIGVTDPSAETVHLVHVGVLFHLITTELDFKGEDDKHTRSWLVGRELTERFSYMERWSQIVMGSFLNLVPAGTITPCPEPIADARVEPRHHHHHHDPAA